MNAEVTFEDESGSHKVKLMDFENLGGVVVGRQKIRSSFVRRTIGAAEVTEIKTLPKTKLREVMKMTPLRLMFNGGRIESFDAIESHPTNSRLLRCRVTADPDLCETEQYQTIEANCPVTVIFD